MIGLTNLTSLHSNKVIMMPTKPRWISREAETRPHDEWVLLIHGLASNRLVMKPLEWHLRRQGYRTLNWGYRSMWSQIESHAERLGDTLEQLDQRDDVRHIRLVTHSMGSILARNALLERSYRKVNRMVMLGPPNRGSRVATIAARGLGWFCKPLKQLSDAADSYVNRLGTQTGIETGVIAASNDRVVALESTFLPGISDHVVVQSGHTSMLFRNDVAHHVDCFLRVGRFATEPPCVTRLTPDFSRTF
jgi:pimeloyl-ACP methyl ester carboxylesterase